MNFKEKRGSIRVKALMLLFLVIAATAGIFKYGFSRTFPQIGAAVLAAAIAELILVYIKKKKLIFPSSAIITGLIIALVLRPGVSLVPVIFASSTAILAKYLIRFDNRHIFNPANLGLLLTALIFNEHLLWWGEISFWLIIVGGVLIALKFRRIHLILSFFIPSAVALGAYGLASGIPLKNSLLLINYFFLFVMVVEPKTSPVKSSDRVIYGMMTALFSAGFIMAGLTSLDPWVLGLACSNIFVPIINRKTGIKKNKPRVEYSDKNAKICARYCGNCPTFPKGEGEMLFCARGKSEKSSIEKKGCRCPDCEVQKDYGCTGTYYCIYGKCS